MYKDRDIDAMINEYERHIGELKKRMKTIQETMLKYMNENKNLKKQIRALKKNKEN